MKTRIDIITEAVAGVFTALQPDELLRYISLGLTCISVIASLCFTIYKWHKTAVEDGRITTDELAELVDELGKHANEMKKR